MVSPITLQGVRWPWFEPLGPTVILSFIRYFLAFFPLLVLLFLSPFARSSLFSSPYSGSTLVAPFPGTTAAFHPSFLPFTPLKGFFKVFVVIPG